MGKDKLSTAAQWLLDSIQNNKTVLVVVDSDCDGYCSSAILINYLYLYNPGWTQKNLDYYLHNGKEHGIGDLNLKEVAFKYSLIIVPDAGSGDFNEQYELSQLGTRIIVLDHHPIPTIEQYENTVIINNQLCDYPNKALSGGGITWQFCRYLDIVLKLNNANNFLDLVATALVGDMMSLLNKETKHLVQNGLQEKNIKNPFLYSIIKKNSYSMGNKITPTGIAFYVVPYINAMVRSGETEEKRLLFNSLLNFKAFKRVPSTKRGHSAGEVETLVEQALRVCANVKNRQTKRQDAMVEQLEKEIEKNNMLDHKVLVFLLEDNKEKNIFGLIANKMMAKYQRHCCILSKVEKDGEVFFEGSARGYDKNEGEGFKTICEETGLAEYTQGHMSAFGCGWSQKNIPSFISSVDEKLKNIDSEITYFVDYIFTGSDINGNILLNISNYNNLWGKDIDEPLVAIEKIKVTKDMVSVYEKKDLTLKIQASCGISLMLFKASPDLCDKLRYDNEGYIELNIVGTANANSWNGKTTPQIFIKDYEITDEQSYYF